MEPLPQTPGLPAALPTARYARHRPEATLLYELVDQHYPPFLAALEQDGRTLPTFVQQEFAAYLKCGRLEHGFLRARCAQCHAERLVAFNCKRRGFCPSCGARRMVETAALLVDEVLPRQPLRQWVLSVPFPLRFLFATEPAALTAVLGIVYRAIAAHLIRRAGLKQSAAQTGAVTLIQRFGSALNLNIHFHLLVLDGVYLRTNDRLTFRRVPPPTKAELDGILRTITGRVGRHLQRRGWLTRDAESSHLTLDREATALDSLLSHSITYRIALGSRAGQKAFTLRSLPGTPLPQPSQPFLASADGFSLHAGVAAGADERKKVERLCRYIARPAIAEGRLSLTGQGHVRYTLKTPFRDGTTHVVFEPLDSMARLAALVPRPRVHLTRYHGVFAPHSRWRAEVTPAGRGKSTAPDLRTPAERHRAMTWAQRLKRVFGIEIETCEQCGGKVRVLASIEDPTVIGQILGHLASRELPAGSRPPSRGPPQGELESPLLEQESDSGKPCDHRTANHPLGNPRKPGNSLRFCDGRYSQQFTAPVAGVPAGRTGAVGTALQSEYGRERRRRHHWGECLMTALLARIPGLAPCLVLAIALGGCGGGVGGGGAVSGAYVPKYPDSPVMFYERIDFQSGGKVAVTAFGDTQTGQYAIAEDGTVLVTLASGTAARFTDVGGGCLLGVTDPGLVEAAAEDGIDLNEVGKICRE